MRIIRSVIVVALAALLLMSARGVSPAVADDQATSPETFKKHIFRLEAGKAVDSLLKVAVGDALPPFSLPTVKGGRVSLDDYLGRSNLVLSFVPAAWTPVCSDQWPGYNIAREVFERYDTALVGISVDNTPTQYAWTTEMGGLWFPVASDFWPHGAFAERLGILRSDGMSERALFLVDRLGIIRFIDVHDINTRPDLGPLVRAMQALQ